MKRWFSALLLAAAVPAGAQESVTVTADPVRLHLTGPARETYLGLWNRGDLDAGGDPAALADWRELTRIGW